MTDPTAPTTPLPALAALRAAVEGTSRVSGEPFFPALCQALCTALDVPHALVSELVPPGDRLRLLGACWEGVPSRLKEYPVDGTPCGLAIARGETIHIPAGASGRYPTAESLQRHAVDAYLGTPLFDPSGRKVGVLCVMSGRPIDFTRGPRELLELFAARASAEMERLRLERQLSQSQRLEGMGRLAAGVAHDFNNLITVMLANAEFAYAALPAGSPVRDFVAPIHDAAHRATHLTRQLLAFARHQPAAPAVVDLRAALPPVLRLLDRLLGNRTRIVQRLDARGAILIDPGQLEQVILNLAINARDAMPSGGAVTIEAVDLAIGDEDAVGLGVAPGEWVRLTVRDEGTGMDEETRNRCFEPFFTTKGERGTGLGLATCHGIVRQAGGQIAVESAPGTGTTFRLLFPRVTGPVVAPPATTPGALPAARREAVLVVDGDPTILEVARRALEQEGLRALTASSGADALRILEGRRDEVDLLLTDLAVPGASGPELSAQARVLRPGLRVLFVAGAADADTVAGLSRTGDPILPKPYAPADLVARVRKLLGR